MRARILVVLLFVTLTFTAQTSRGTFAQAPKDAPAPKAPAKAAPKAAAFRQEPMGNLLQIMRAINYPNSNAVFDLQRTAPKDGYSTLEKDDKSIYGGWESVENAQIAMAEMANLIMLPGRKCANGLPVPINREDYREWAENLRKVAMDGYKIAQTKNQEKMSEYTDALTEACALCHEKYRDVGEGIPDRCGALDLKKKK